MAMAIDPVLSCLLHQCRDPFVILFLCMVVSKMIDETSLQKLWDSVHDEPEDWNRRLILADALEEAGQDILAAGQRWQAEHQKKPLFTGMVYRWYNDFYYFGGSDIESDLPNSVSDLLESKTHYTKKAAEIDLANALEKFDQKMIANARKAAGVINDQSG